MKISQLFLFLFSLTLGINTNIYASTGNSIGFQTRIIEPIKPQQKKKKDRKIKSLRKNSKNKLELTSFLLLTLIPLIIGLGLFLTGIFIGNIPLWIIGLSLFGIMNLTIIFNLINKYDLFDKEFLTAYYTFIFLPTTDLVIGLSFLILGLSIGLITLWVVGLSIIILLLIIFAALLLTQK